MRLVRRNSTSTRMPGRRFKALGAGDEAREFGQTAQVLAQLKVSKPSVRAMRLVRWGF